MQKWVYEMDEKYYTIKNIADIVGVSKVTMFRYIKKESIHETIKKGNTNLYDETAKCFIIKGFKEKNVSIETETMKRNDSNFELIKIMKFQIDAKDKQIAKLHEIIKQDQKVLDQSQQLQLMAEKKIAALEAPKENEASSKPAKSETGSEMVTEGRKKEPRPQKRGFWNRIFK